VRAAQLALSEAIEDNDVASILRALAKASAAGVPAAERESAQRVLEFELFRMQSRAVEFAAVPDLQSELLQDEASRTEQAAEAMREKVGLKVDCQVRSEREEIEALRRELQDLSAKHRAQLQELSALAPVAAERRVCGTPAAA